MGKIWLYKKDYCMPDKLVSRKRECEELLRCLDSDRSDSVIKIVRRRISKTYLIDKFFNYKYDFTFDGEHKTFAIVQIKNFHEGNSSVLKEVASKNFYLVRCFQCT